MITGDTARYAWKELRRRKIRTLGTITSFVIIAVIVVVITTLLIDTRDATRVVLWDIGAHSVAYVPRLERDGSSVQLYGSSLFDPDREGFVVNNAPSNLISPEQIRKIQQSPNVLEASPYLMFRIRSSSGAGEWVLGGIDLTRPKAYPATVVAGSQVLEGHFLKPGDKNLVMVETEFASTHNLKTGSDLVLGDRTYKVAAIVQPPLRPGKANIYMSLPDLRELVSSRLREPVSKDLANAVLIESKGARYHKQAQADINEILGQSCCISSFGCSKPGVMAMGISENTAWTIIGIIILFMFLFAMEIQYSSVIKRRQDIGILKAIGWNNREVVSQIMAEAVICSVIGGTAGVLLACIVLILLPPVQSAGAFSLFKPAILAAGFLLPVSGGIISGLVASAKAAGTRTAETLRTI